MTKYDLIKELLEKVDEFWNDSTRVDKRFETFCAYLSSGVKTQSEHINYLNTMWSKSDSLGYLLGKMCRYGRFYNRELFKHTAFSTPEEFGLAASLLHGKTPKKSELLNREVIELPTGMAILKRLVAKGILMEIHDSDDKRALRIGLTPFGRQKVLEAFEVLAPLNHVLAGSLDQKEIDILVDILQKLDLYHHDNHGYLREKLTAVYEKDQST
ncbi:MAG: MarR family winged helix-turn-helix transcriptional regulator [Thermaurantimonas sp.]